jgi:hypothetical protein
LSRPVRSIIGWWDCWKHEVTLEVTGEPSHYHGATKLKQSEFGIKPISMGGGSIKVKDELELEFDVYPAAK